MKTTIQLELVVRTTGEREGLSKSFGGYVMPPFRHEKQNFHISIGGGDDGDDHIQCEVQAIWWKPEQNEIVIRTAYVTYEDVDEMRDEAEELRERGWK